MPRWTSKRSKAKKVKLERPVIVCWFSCGAASAVAAKKTVDIYGETHKVVIVNNPIKEEHEDNRRFLKDCAKWIGRKIHIAKNPNFKDSSCVHVWEKRKFMSGTAGAPCTFELKKKARQIWESKNKHDFLVMGFHFGEQNRASNFRLTERENLITPLIDLKLTKEDCKLIVESAGIEMPEIYKLGYPNANCVGCVKATSPTYWNHVRNVHPKEFKERAEQSRALGAKLVRVRGERIFLDELDPKDQGRPMKTMDFECGIFCEEKLL